MADTSLAAAPQKKRRPPLALQLLPLVFKGLSSTAPGLAARLFAYLFTRPPRQKLPRRERDWLHQAAGRPLELSTGQTVPFYEWRAAPYLPAVQDEAPQPTVLLVHGFGGRAGQMGGFAAPLVAAGYRVVSFDAPAHGAAAGNRSSLPEMMEALLEVAKRIGPLQGIVAHSNGASAVIAALARGLQAERLALLAPMPNLQSYMDRLARQIGFSPLVVELTRARIEARYGLPFEELKARNLVPDLPHPTLILQDQKDRVVSPREVEELAQAWPSADLRLSEGLGHNRLLRDSATIAAVVEHFGPATQR